MCRTTAVLLVLVACQTAPHNSRELCLQKAQTICAHSDQCKYNSIPRGTCELEAERFCPSEDFNCPVDTAQATACLTEISTLECQAIQTAPTCDAITCSGPVTCQAESTPAASGGCIIVWTGCNDGRSYQIDSSDDGNSRCQDGVHAEQQFPDAGFCTESIEEKRAMRATLCGWNF